MSATLLKENPAFKALFLTNVLQYMEIHLERIMVIVLMLYLGL